MEATDLKYKPRKYIFKQFQCSLMTSKPIAFNTLLLFVVIVAHQELHKEEQYCL